MPFQMPERQPNDGEVNLRRLDKGKIQVSVMTDGNLEGITMSEYNAARVFGILALFLEIPLPKSLAKQIKL